MTFNLLNVLSASYHPTSWPSKKTSKCAPTSILLLNNGGIFVTENQSISATNRDHQHLLLNLLPGQTKYIIVWNATAD